MENNEVESNDYDFNSNDDLESLLHLHFECLTCFKRSWTYLPTLNTKRSTFDDWVQRPYIVLKLYIVKLFNSAKQPFHFSFSFFESETVLLKKKMKNILDISYSEHILFHLYFIHETHSFTDQPIRTSQNVNHIFRYWCLSALFQILCQDEKWNEKCAPESQIVRNDKRKRKTLIENEKCVFRIAL